MRDNGLIRENTENSKNTSGRPPHDLLRARAHEQQAAGESSSMRNEYSDRGRFPSNEQEGHLTGADRTRLDLPPIMVTIEKHISEHNKKLWEKQCSENLMRLNEHKEASKKWKADILNQLFKVAKDARSEASSSSHDQDAQATLPQMSQEKKDNLNEDGLKKSKMVHQMIERSPAYVKANLARAIDDWALHSQQISKRGNVEKDAWNKATRLEYTTQDPEGQAYYAKRWEQFDKQWGEVIKGWAENYKWITKDRICIIRGDLGETNEFDKLFNCNGYRPYSRYEKIENAIYQLISDDTKCSRLFNLQFVYFRKKADQ